MENSEPIHILIRYSDKLFHVKNSIGIHKKIISKYGAVYFGKVGKPLASSFINTLNKQINEKIKTDLILVEKVSEGYQVFTAPLLKVTREYPDKEKKIIPDYYFDGNLFSSITLWLKIKSIKQIEFETLRNFKALSSINLIPETLATSIAGMFIIKKAPNILRNIK